MAEALYEVLDAALRRRRRAHHRGIKAERILCAFVPPWCGNLYILAIRVVMHGKSEYLGRIVSYGHC
jgi:hypothetical protein